MTRAAQFDRHDGLCCPLIHCNRSSRIFWSHHTTEISGPEHDGHRFVRIVACSSRESDMKGIVARSSTAKVAPEYFGDATPRNFWTRTRRVSCCLHCRLHAVDSSSHANPKWSSNTQKFLRIHNSQKFLGNIMATGIALFALSPAYREWASC